MRSAKEILNSMDGAPATVRCLRCGEEVLFAPGQWGRPCPSCGLRITLSRHFRAVVGLAPARKARCPYCHDTGVLIVEEQKDCSFYERAYRCVCEKGLARPEKAVPVAYDIDLSRFLRDGSEVVEP